MPQSSVFPLVIFLLVALGLIVLCILMIRKNFKELNNRRDSKKQAKQKLKDMGGICSVSLSHIYGLPFPEGVLCNLALYEDKYAFERNGQTFNLPFEKVQDVSIKTEVDIQNNYVSSIGGAVGGAILFGPLGAAIGGRAKNKQDTKIRSYLIFAYKKDENVDFIAFGCATDPKAYKFVEAFDNIPKQQSNVDL